LGGADEELKRRELLLQSMMMEMRMLWIWMDRLTMSWPVEVVRCV
jgi:hypothetical protein